MCAAACLIPACCAPSHACRLPICCLPAAALCLLLPCACCCLLAPRQRMTDYVYVLDQSRKPSRPSAARTTTPK